MEKILSLSLEQSNFTTPPSGPGTKPTVRVRRLAVLFNGRLVCDISTLFRCSSRTGAETSFQPRPNPAFLLKLGVRAVANPQSHGTIQDNVQRTAVPYNIRFVFTALFPSTFLRKCVPVRLYGAKFP